MRRTAIHLLREFGGNEALPELAPLIDDKEPNVQREAIRAIVNIGTDEAFAVLEKALAERQRAVARSHQRRRSCRSRDERAIPLFCHILRNARVPAHAADRVRSGHGDARGRLAAPRPWQR